MEVTIENELDLNIRAKSIVYFTVQFLKWAPTDYLMTAPFFAMKASCEAYLAIKWSILERAVEDKDRDMIKMTIDFLSGVVLLSEFKQDTVEQLTEKTIQHLRTIV